ncbi:MAG: alpha/beta fold hydrolase [Proteobacteria bacterium]|nr:alpha/beta fold hydrolase [Pseudomonadota bacterium]
MSRILCLLVLCLGFLTQAAAKDELLEISGRNGVKVKTLLTWQPETKAQLVVILLPGGKGDYRFSASVSGISMIREQRLPNRLRPLLLQRNVASLMVDAPSDMPEMDDDFRASASHLTDLKAVVVEANKRFPGAPIVVVGHSNGSMSATYLAAATPQQLIGAILIDGRLAKRIWFGDGLSKYDWNRIKIPLLLIHHRKDDCYATPYQGSEEVAKRVPRFELLVIDPPGSKATGGCTYESTHNLLGQEAVVADAIVRWAEKQLKK